MALIEVQLMTNVIWCNHEAEYLNLEYIWLYTTNLIIIFLNIFKYVFQDAFFFVLVHKYYCFRELHHITFYNLNCPKMSNNMTFRETNLEMTQRFLYIF